MYQLYQHIRPDTNEIFYIGRAGMNGKRPWESRKRSKFWENIVSKNKGIFVVEILEKNLSNEEVNLREIELIKKYGRQVNNTGPLVNFQEGGSNHTGYKHSEEALEKMRIASMGNKYSLGHKHSEESKTKMSLSRKGRISWNKGKKHPEEVLLKMSTAHKGNNSNKGRMHINNGLKSTTIPIMSEIPEGWKKGRLITWEFKNKSKQSIIKNK